jgi:hypothetical protein
MSPEEWGKQPLVQRAIPKLRSQITIRWSIGLTSVTIRDVDTAARVSVAVDKAFQRMVGLTFEGVDASLGSNGSVIRARFSFDHRNSARAAFAYALEVIEARLPDEYEVASVMLKRVRPEESSRSGRRSQEA